MVARRSPDRPLVIAHQGGALEAPSSTLFALRSAVEAGADMLEIDLHATADGHVVVLHDDTVDRTTDGSGAVAAMALADVQALDAAHWFVPGRGAVGGLAPDAPPGAYPWRGVATGHRPPPPGATAADFRIPTLAEVLAALPGVPVTMDIKRGPPATAAYEHAVAEVLAAHGRAADVVVASFATAVLTRFRRLAPGVPTSASQDEATAFWLAAHHGTDPGSLPYVALQLPWQHEGVEVITPALLAAARRADLAVHVWTVDDVDRMRALAAAGVDGIVTDRPRAALAALAAPPRGG